MHSFPKSVAWKFSSRIPLGNNNNVRITSISFSLFPVSPFNLTQLFSYPSLNSVTAMSGVISPTNLSLFSSPVTVNSPMRPVSRHPSAGSLPRWTPPTSVNNTGPGGPFISLDEDYMMTPLISGNSNETNNALIDDGECRL